MESSDKSGIWVSGSVKPLYGGRRGSGSKTRVLIVDGHERYRESLAASFNLEPDIEAVGQASNGQAALDEAGRLRPDVVLMGTNIPGMPGMEATRRLTDTYTGIIVIVLTMNKGEEHLREARRAGASAYVMRDAPTDVLVQTIRDVMSGQMPLLQRENDAPTSRSPGPPDEARSDPPAPRGPATGYLITSRERDILRLLAEGLTNDEIAQHLHVQLYMIRTYIAEVCRKLGLPDRDAAVHYARTRFREDDASR